MAGGLNSLVYCVRCVSPVSVVGHAFRRGVCGVRPPPCRSLRREPALAFTRAAQACSPLGAHRGDALCSSSPRRPVTPSEGDRKSRRRVSVRLWLRVTSAPPLFLCPLSVSRPFFPFLTAKWASLTWFWAPWGRMRSRVGGEGARSEGRSSLQIVCNQATLWLEQVHG